MNKNKCVTSAKKSNKKTDKDLYTIILISDTPGYRMKSYGPTSLISFSNDRLIDIQINSIDNSFDNYEIIVCCGNESEKVHRHIKLNYPNKNIRIVENQLFNNSNSCESARLAINNTANEKVYIVDGRLLIYPETFKNRIDSSYVYIEENPCENLEVGINVNEKDFIEHFSYGASKIWSEIIYIGEKTTLESFRKIISNIDFKNKFLFEAMNELLKVKQDIKYLVNHSSLKKVNNIKTYHSAKEMA